METKLVIFLMFTSVTLIFNSFVIWLAYKAFANVSTMVTETVREAEASQDASAWIRALEAASSHAVVVTNATKTQLLNFDPVLSRAQAKFGFRLAEIDVQVERSLARALEQTEKAQRAVTGPARRLGATLSGVQEVIHYLSGDESDDDARSRPRR